ncbi:MAG: beta-N-acetylhexosaminidase [Bdellovibrionales bacterium]|nr:beta-N-acetylhexosaminidase [Bdellovibrionales bacterium]
MSAKELEKIKKAAGQLFLMGLAGPSISAQEKKIISEFQIGGAIYFARNVESPAQVRSLSYELYQALEVLPLIGIDQEGGRVARLHQPFTEFPGNDYLGKHYKKSKDAKLARLQAAAMAVELKSVGINLNFTPVVDVHSNPNNPIIGPRAFCSDPKNVAALAKITIQEYKKQSVVCCAKHFPGHGDTDVDSHLTLPLIRASQKVLEERELLPFKTCISESVPTIMTAHIMFPALDRKYPATLSKKILQGLLREKMGYKGLIISDDMEMKAIAENWSIPQACVMALQAGVDLVLVCKSLEELSASYDAVVKAIESKKLSQERVSQALRRISRLKTRYVKKSRFSALHRPGKYGWDRHQRLAEKIKSLGGS